MGVLNFITRDWLAEYKDRKYDELYARHIQYSDYDLDKKYGVIKARISGTNFMFVVYTIIAAGMTVVGSQMTSLGEKYKKELDEYLKSDARVINQYIIDQINYLKYMEIIILAVFILLILIGVWKRVVIELDTLNLSVIDDIRRKRAGKLSYKKYNFHRKV